MQPTRTDNRFLFFPLLTLIILTLLFVPAAALPNGTETIITTGTAGSFQWNPEIFGDVIAWDDQRAGPNIVYAYNLLTGRGYPVLPDPSNPMLWQFAPSVSGDWIVWQQDDGVSFPPYSIVAYNNATLETIAIPAVPRNADWGGYFYDTSDNVMPKTNGTTVVWQDYTNNPYWGVYLYDLSSGSGGSAEPIIADPAFDQKSPDISGDYIVYENWSSGDSDIYLYFGSNRTSVQISTGPDNDLSPAVDGNRIVWQRYNTTSGYHEVFSHDILTGETRQVTPLGSPFSQTRPRISGDLVVVEDERNVTAQIYAYDLSLFPPREIWVTPNSEMMKKNPALSGNRIVWEDYRNSPLGNDADIYLITLGPVEVCPAADFTISPSAADPGDTVVFTAATAQPGASAISHFLWNFGDGSPEELSGDLTATHQYAADGVYAVTLTVENPECRTISAETCSHEVFVNSPPVADFTLNPEYGLAPLTVRFTDTSCGAPLTWAWDFGDGSTSHGQNPTHIYSSPGKDYTVSLTVNNTRGAYGTSTVTKQVRTFMGGQDTATLPINGITVDDRFGDRFLTFNSDLVPLYSPKPPAFPLTVHPPPEYGWDTIRFMGSDSIGISPHGANITYFGNSSRIFLTTRNVIATTSGSVPDIGTNWGANYLINTTAYPETASLKTEVWEDATPKDRVDIDTVAVRATVPVLIRDIAYTVNITKQGFTHEGDEKINMSVGHSWAASAHRLYIIGTGIDSQGNKIGALIPARHLFQAGDLDYYEGDIPEVASFLTTFALVNVEGSYNPLQLITLTVTTHVPEPAPSYDPSVSDSDGPAIGTGAGAGKDTVPVITTAATTVPTPVPTQDPGTSAKIYSNGNGIVTQATRLQSADGLVTVFIGEGVAARDATGALLPEITIKALPAGSLPAVPAGSVFTFAGMAYEILPDEATFSPPFSLSFVIPQARWGQDYSVKTWDSRSQTWQDLPSEFDGSTGTITAQVSHLCTFALFAQPLAAPPTTAATPLQAAVVTTLPTAVPTPATAVSTFASMLSWATGLVVNNAVILAVVIVLLIAVYLGWQRRFPGAGQ